MARKQATCLYYQPTKNMEVERKRKVRNEGGISKPKTCRRGLEAPILLRGEEEYEKLESFKLLMPYVCFFFLVPLRILSSCFFFSSCYRALIFRFVSFSFFCYKCLSFRDFILFCFLVFFSLCVLYSHAFSEFFLFEVKG